MARIEFYANADYGQVYPDNDIADDKVSDLDKGKGLVFRLRRWF